MGYTHYFKQLKPHTPKQWDAFIEECKKLRKHLPKHTDTAGGFYKNEVLQLAGGDGTGSPAINVKEVCFNGKDEMSHETFWIDADPTKNGWNICKTARKPYDLMVVAVLISAVRNINYGFSSDGFYKKDNHSDLAPAMEYYNKVINPETPVTIEELEKQRDKYNE